VGTRRRDLSYKDDWKGWRCCRRARGIGHQEHRRVRRRGGWLDRRLGDRGIACWRTQSVGANVDGGLIDDYDLTRGWPAGAGDAAHRGDEAMRGRRDRRKDGRRYPSPPATTARRGRQAARTQGWRWASSGAFQRAHNGRLLALQRRGARQDAIARHWPRQKFTSRRSFWSDAIGLRRRSSPSTKPRPGRVESRSTPCSPRPVRCSRRRHPAQKAGDFVKAAPRGEGGGADLDARPAEHACPVSRERKLTTSRT